MRLTSDEHKQHILNALQGSPTDGMPYREFVDKLKSASPSTVDFLPRLKQAKWIKFTVKANLGDEKPMPYVSVVNNAI